MSLKKEINLIIEQALTLAEMKQKIASLIDEHKPSAEKLGELKFLVSVIIKIAEAGANMSGSMTHQMRVAKLKLQINNAFEAIVSELVAPPPITEEQLEEIADNRWMAIKAASEKDIDLYLLEKLFKEAFKDGVKICNGRNTKQTTG